MKNLTEAVLEMINETSMTYETVYKSDTVLNLDINTNAKIYDIIRDILGEFGIKDQGKCGGGFEFYPLTNGMFLALGWNSSGPNKFHLGTMGTAF